MMGDGCPVASELGALGSGRTMLGGRVMTRLTAAADAAGDELEGCWAPLSGAMLKVVELMTADGGCSSGSHVSRRGDIC